MIGLKMSYCSLEKLEQLIVDNSLDGAENRPFLGF